MSISYLFRQSKYKSANDTANRVLLPIFNRSSSFVHAPFESKSTLLAPARGLACAPFVYIDNVGAGDCTWILVYS